MICPKCNANLPDGAKFCGACGEKIVYTNTQNAAVNNNPTSNQLPPNVIRRNRIILILVICFVFLFFRNCGHGGGNSFSKDDKFISAAKQIVSEDLRNPDSAKFYEAEIVEKDQYGRAVVYIDMSAENAFGGAVRSRKYVFVNKIEGDSYFYNPNFSYMEVDRKLSNPSSDPWYESYKDFNNFGQPQDN